MLVPNSELRSLPCSASPSPRPASVFNFSRRGQNASPCDSQSYLCKSQCLTYCANVDGLANVPPMAPNRTAHYVQLPARSLKTRFSAVLSSLRV
jgi:hypothetical protein